MGGRGWTLSAKAFPFPEMRNCIVKVNGYDTWLSKSDIQCQLSKLFSSCGKIKEARIFESFSQVFLEGEDVVENAPKLNGSDIGGRKVVVKLISQVGKATVHPRRLKGCSIGLNDLVRPPPYKTAKMALD